MPAILIEPSITTMKQPTQLQSSIRHWRMQVLSLTIGLMLCLPGIASAQANPTVRLDRAPLPFPLSGFLSTAHQGKDMAGNFGDNTPGATVGWRIHENFSFPAAESIREIHWRGLYLMENDRSSNPVEGTNTEQWELRIWSDNNGEPGTALYTEVLDFAEVPSAVDGMNEWRGLEIPRYAFEWELAEPFVTQPGTIYWFSILSLAEEFEPMFVVSEGFGGDLGRGASMDPEVIAVAIDSSSYLQRNLQENKLYARWGTQALTIVSVPANDADEDGMDDDWELAHGLSAEEDESSSDPNLIDTDRDSISNLDELGAQTDPTRNDSDSDGVLDAWELDHFTDPNDPEDPLSVATAFPSGGATSQWNSVAALPATFNSYMGGARSRRCDVPALGRL